MLKCAKYLHILNFLRLIWSAIPASLSTYTLNKVMACVTLLYMHQALNQNKHKKVEFSNSLGIAGQVFFSMQVTINAENSKIQHCVKNCFWESELSKRQSITRMLDFLMRHNEQRVCSMLLYIFIFILVFILLKYSASWFTHAYNVIKTTL